MKLYHSLKPCYKRKIFRLDGHVLTFDFGESRSYNPSDGTTITHLIATYVVHVTDKHGNPTGTTSCHVNWVSTVAEGELAFEAADEVGAAAYLAEYLKSRDYSQFKDIMGMIGLGIKRQVLHWRWQVRAWKRRSH